MKDTTGKVEHLCETLTTLNHFINPKNHSHEEKLSHMPTASTPKNYDGVYRT